MSDTLSILAAIVLASVATATAPAATLMVVKQYKAKGPVGVPAIKQIETYKLKRRKGTGNFSLPVPFFGFIQILLCRSGSA